MGSRAWLRTADEAKKLQQTQFRPIIDNVSLSISAHEDLYSSVTKTWTGALMTMNGLTEGQPQRINDGGILLALSSWHLYPDMSVFEQEPHKIAENDTLITQGGMITLGLQNNREGANDGVWWSLPLAHMRYYGETIVSARNTGLSNVKVSFEQFLFVVLGSVLGTWDVPEHNTDPALALVMHLSGTWNSLGNRLSHAKRYCSQANWLQSLSGVCHKFKSLSTSDREEHRRLIAFGMRRCSGLLGRRGDSLCPAFGLTNISLLLNTMPVREHKIRFLRQWALDCKPNSRLDGAVIRVRPNSMFSVFHYTDLFPNQYRRSKRKRHNKEPQHSEVHHSWRERRDNEILDSGILDDGLFIMPPATTENYFSRRIPRYEIQVPSQWDPNCDEGVEEYELYFGDPLHIASFRPAKGKDMSASIHNHLEVHYLLHLIKIGIISTSQLVDLFVDSVLPRSIFIVYLACLDSLY